MESRYQELDRIDEEIRKAKEREQKWQLKKRRKMKEIQEAERVEREAWYKVITEALDTAFRGRNGSLYWEKLDPEMVASHLCRAVSITVIDSTDSEAHVTAGKPKQEYEQEET